MNDFLKSVRFKILIGLLTVMLGFMIMAVYTGGTASFFGQIVSIVTVPVQRLTSDLSYNVSEFFNQFINARRLHAEKDALQEEVNRLRRNQADYEKLKHENEQFRQIIGFMENRQDLTIETASVIARENVGRFYAFTIDKGTLDGIKRLDPVMTADGLVGYVVEIGVTYAKVVTILDVTVDVGVYADSASAGVGVYNSSTRDIGILTGTIDLAMEGLCVIDYLPRDSEIAGGDIIMTSGGSMFPRDILVGTVTKVMPNSHQTSIAAVIKPTADIASVKEVFVITHFEGQGEK